MYQEKRNEGEGVVGHLTRQLERGCEIVAGLSDRMYAAGFAGESSIGAHIRHNLDFVNALLNGLDRRRIDYNDRTRDPLVETDRDHAVAQLTRACERLHEIDVQVRSSPVLVRSEVDVDMWHTSSVSRELEFLHSHTVHHYAIVAKLIAAQGLVTENGFGVAPSTLRYRAGANY